MKRMHFIIVLSICFISISTIQSSNNGIVKKDEVVKQEENILSPESLLQTIHRELKDSKYRQDVLPHNFSYMLQLLEYGKKTKQSREYTQNVFSLFSKLLKGADYVNSYTFCALLEQVPSLLRHHFTFIKTDSPTQQLMLQDMDVLERFKQTVSTTLFSSFSKDFSIFKNNPEQFLDDITKQIVSAAHEEVSMELLRQTIIRFIEVGLSKLIWNPHQCEQSWENLKTTSHYLAAMLEFNILTDINDLDELFWTLTHRYRYFLELNSVDMPLSFYDKIKSDLATQHLILFDLEEQESFLQTKADCLKQTILTQEARKRAYDLEVREPQVF